MIETGENIDNSSTRNRGSLHLVLTAGAIGWRSGPFVQICFPEREDYVSWFRREVLSMKSVNKQEKSSI
jgi:hypothetical protein